jgi:hypothetical protein
MNLTEKIERAKTCVSFDPCLSGSGNCVKKGYAPFDCDRCGSYKKQESGEVTVLGDDTHPEKNCKFCGTKMVWGNPHNPGHLQASSCNIEDRPICHECMIEHCCHTNCLGCEYGKYPECRFLDMKRHYMSGD